MDSPQRRKEPAVKEPLEWRDVAAELPTATTRRLKRLADLAMKVDWTDDALQPARAVLDRALTRRLATEPAGSPATFQLCRLRDYLHDS